MGDSKRTATLGTPPASHIPHPTFHFRLSTWLLGLCLAAVFTAAPLGAQDDPVDQEKYKNGLMPTGTYDGALTAVNTQNGGYTVAVPLFSLPGRGGMDLSLALTYNSKQLTRRYDGNQWVGRWFNENATVGRWVINAWPSMKEEVPGQLYYFTTADGSVHKLASLDGGYLYTEDSTAIRYNAYSKKLQFPGGECYDFSVWASQRKIYRRDVNGNQIAYEFHATEDKPVRIVDTLGREVTITYKAPGQNLLIDQIRVKNHAGTDLVYTFNYVQKYVYPAAWGWNGLQYVRYYGCDATEVAGDQWLLSEVALPDGRTYGFSYLDDQVPQAGGYYIVRSTVQLSSMTLPTGATVTYGYLSVADVDARLAKYVSSIETDPIGGGEQTTLYGYQFDASYAGVLKTTVTRADGSKRIIDFNPSTTQNFANMRKSESWTDVDGTTVLRQIDTLWTMGGMGAQVSAVTASEPGTDWAVYTTRVMDQWGREVESKVYDRKVQHWITGPRYWWVLNSAVYRQFADVNPSTYVGGPLQVDVVDPYGLDERVVATTRYRYDEYPLVDRGAVVGQASGYGPSNTNRGNLTSVSRELFSESRSVETHLRYDTVGNVVESEDQLGRSSTMGYSATFHYAYPTTATNPLGQATSTGYNFNTGLPASTTDANGQTTTFQYETYNRVSREDYPDGGWKTYQYEDGYVGGTGGKYRGRVFIRRSVFGATYDTTIAYNDGLGRRLLTQRIEPGTIYVNVSQEYAACSCMGKTARVSLPYRNGETIRWTETRFDGIGRVTLVIPTDGTASSNRTEYKYGVTEMNSLMYRVEAAFDAAGVGSARVLDAAGALVQAREDVGYSTLNSSTVTDYDRRPDAAYTSAYHQRYNPGTGGYSSAPVHLTNWTWTEILQGAQTRSLKMDSLGRTVSETHPENGTTSYVWGDPGTLVSKTDARGIATTLSYDALNRPLTIAYSDGTPAALYDYDQGAYGIGRLHSASNANASEVHTYDNMGRVTAQSKTIGGLLFTTSSTFNYAGLPETTTLADGTTVDWSWDRTGRLTQVASDRIDATHPAILASNFVYDAAGATLSADWGNGTTTLQTFNQNEQLETLQHGPSANPGQFLNLEYDYNEGVANTGKIVSIIDHNDTTKTVNYTYDHFNRLKTAATSGAHWGLSWTYDRYGNRLSQTATKGSPPTNSLSISTATNRVNGWTYDAAGNTLNDGVHSYAYDANNMIKTVDGGSVQYKYAAGGERVMKVTGSGTAYYAYGAEYSSVSGWTRVFLLAGGIKVEYRENQTYFHQADHLGTPRAQSDSAGNLVETWSYYPFGEQWQQAGSGGNEHRFTGHRRDPETNNDYAGKRYLEGVVGRWLSADPNLGDTANPQRLNRYDYALNDPVNLVDPTGGFPQSPSDTTRRNEAFITICTVPSEGYTSCITVRNPFYAPGGYRPSYLPDIPPHPTGPPPRKHCKGPEGQEYDQFALDTYALAFGIFLEGRGTGPNGQQAIGEVILNRYYRERASGRDITIADVLLSPSQFSPFAMGGAPRAALLDDDPITAIANYVNGLPDDGAAALFEGIVQLASSLLDGAPVHLLPTNTYHFISPNRRNSLPSWWNTDDEMTVDGVDRGDLAFLAGRGFPVVSRSGACVGQ